MESSAPASGKLLLSSVSKNSRPVNPATVPAEKHTSPPAAGWGVQGALAEGFSERSRA